MISVMIVIFLGVFFYKGFLPQAGALEDGFQAQLLYVASLLGDGLLVEVSLQSSLVLVHLIRFFTVFPFVGLGAVLGPISSLIFLVALLIPLIQYPKEPGISYLNAIPLILPLLVSGRAVLVAAGVGYIIIFLLRPGTPVWTLWLGLCFVNLSSASVMTAILLLMFVPFDQQKKKMYGLHRWLVLSLLVFSFLASMFDKLEGFGQRDSGYESHSFTSDNLLMMVLSRSTLLVSFFEGQYLRGIAYLAVVIYFSIKLVGLMMSRRYSVGRRVLLCCLPGILMEGLGIWALLFPLVWLMAGWRRDLTLPSINRMAKFPNGSLHRRSD